MKKFLVSFLTLIVIFSVSVAAARALFDTPYIGNSFRHKFHYRDCPSVHKMWKEHQVPFATREEAIKAGYAPCKNCRP